MGDRASRHLPLGRGRPWRFIHIPKTGGTALTCTYPQIVHGHPHATASEVPDHVFKFTIIRNPFDRMVSLWAYQNRQSDFLPVHHFRQWIREPTDHPLRPNVFLLSPQTTWVDDDTYFCLYDCYDEHLGKVLDYLSIPRKPIALKNVSKRTSTQWTDYYDPKTFDIVMQRYRKDVKLYYDLKHEPYPCKRDRVQGRFVPLPT